MVSTQVRGEGRAEDAENTVTRHNTVRLCHIKNVDSCLHFEALDL